MVRQANHQKRIIQAIALMCVYCLHLLFFQVTLANPNNETTKQLKKFFSRKTTLPKRNTTDAVDYAQLHKHANDSDRSCSNFFNASLDLISYSSSVIILNKDCHSNFLSQHGLVHRGKIYMHNQSFLI